MTIRCSTSPGTTPSPSAKRAKPQGGENLPLADRGRVGVCLSRRHRHALQFRRRCRCRLAKAANETTDSKDRTYFPARHESGRLLQGREKPRYRTGGVASGRTTGACMTCTERVGVGSPIGMARITTPSRLWTIRRGPATGNRRVRRGGGWNSFPIWALRLVPQLEHSGESMRESWVQSSER